MLTPPASLRRKGTLRPGAWEPPPSTSISVRGSLPQPHSIPLPTQSVDFLCDSH